MIREEEAKMVLNMLGKVYKLEKPLEQKRRIVTEKLQICGFVEPWIGRIILDWENDNI